MAFPLLFWTLPCAFISRAFSNATKSLFVIFLPETFPLFPVIMLLLTTSPRPFMITVSEASSLLFVKSFELISIRPVPVVLPLFVMLFAEILSLCCPWRFPVRLIFWLTPSSTLFPLIVPVLSNLWAFLINISPDRISPVFVIAELSSKTLPFEAIFPLFVTFAFAAFTLLTAVISLVLIKVPVVKSTSFPE